MRSWSVAAFFALQAVALWWGVGAEQAPRQACFDKLPARIAGWTLVSEDPERAMVERASLADQMVARYYADQQTGLLGHVMIAWYRTQRGGLRQPHQPSICLTAAGWTQSRSERIPMDGFDARRVRAERHGAAAEVVYWYQSRRRALGGEWTAKWWLVLDGARDHRTDGALVRISVGVERGRERECELAARRLAQAIHGEAARLWIDGDDHAAVAR